jgi:GntR family transcriptional regulator, rspAB operon transcriptional repressor
VGLPALMEHTEEADAVVRASIRHRPVSLPSLRCAVSLVYRYTSSECEEGLQEARRVVSSHPQLWQGYRDVNVVFDRQQNVPSQVYDLLRGRIETAELRPGESINERRLSDWLGVSRTPIREAIRRLAGDGLIVIVPHVGTSVALVDPMRVYEFCQIRVSLESAAVAEATRHFTPGIGTQLDGLIEEQDETISSGDAVRNINVDTEFHRLIHRTSGFSTMTEILQRVMGEIIRARHLSIKLPGRLRDPIKEHKAIVAGLRSGDPHQAAAAMKAHLDRSISSIMRVMETNPDFLVAEGGVDRD